MVRNGTREFHKALSMRCKRRQTVGDFDRIFDFNPTRHGNPNAGTRQPAWIRMTHLIFCKQGKDRKRLICSSPVSRSLGSLPLPLLAVVSVSRSFNAGDCLKRELLYTLRFCLPMVFASCCKFGGWEVLWPGACQCPKSPISYVAEWKLATWISWTSLLHCSSFNQRDVRITQTYVQACIHTCMRKLTSGWTDPLTDG